MRISTASTTTPANAETHSARNPLRSLMGRNRTPKTTRSKQTMTTKQRTTTSFKSTRKTDKQEKQANRPTLHSGECDMTNAKPTTQNRRQRRRKTQKTSLISKDKPPIKPSLNAKQAERLQTMTPNKKHHKTERGTHIKWEKLTVNQNKNNKEVKK
jgi:hypothetical protein